MSDPVQFDPAIRLALASIYEEIMWLSVRPNVTPGRARAWYTHIMAESLKRKIRVFTGNVSEMSLNQGAVLRLEHHHRIQTSLSKLVEKHKSDKANNVDEFIELIAKAESVHIVTREENYAAMRAHGDYETAGIRLLSWKDIPRPQQSDLWRTMLKGKVANARSYAPVDVQQAVPVDGPAPRARR